MKFLKEIVAPLIIALIIGVGSAFVVYEGRISRLEEAINNLKAGTTRLEDHIDDIRTNQQNIENEIKDLQILTQPPQSAQQIVSLPVNLPTPEPSPTSGPSPTSEPSPTNTSTPEPSPTSKNAITPESPSIDTPPPVPTFTDTPSPTPPPTDTPLPSPTYTPTNTPTPIVFTVPGVKDGGVRVNIQTTGLYKFTIEDGAYSPWPTDNYPGNQGWTTYLSVYKNRPIEWGKTKDNLIGPINPDANFGVGGYKLNQSDAVSMAKGAGLTIDLNAGDYLVFVPFDEKGQYADNRGEIIITMKQ